MKQAHPAITSHRNVEHVPAVNRCCGVAHRDQQRPRYPDRNWWSDQDSRQYRCIYRKHSDDVHISSIQLQATPHNWAPGHSFLGGRQQPRPQLHRAASLHYPHGCRHGHRGSNDHDVNRRVFP